MITPQYQPPKSALCGQTCVAMICNIPLADAIKTVGHGSSTSGPDLAKALIKRGIMCSPSMIRLGVGGRLFRRTNYYDHLPNRCIAKVRWAGVKKSHWILIWDGETYDPSPMFMPWQYISGYLRVGKTIESWKINICPAVGKGVSVPRTGETELLYWRFRRLRKDCILQCAFDNDEGVVYIADKGIFNELWNLLAEK
jgi:hypothetical protein